MEQNTVTIDLNEYRDFIINQYKLGIYKSSLHAEVEALEKDLADIKERREAFLAEGLKTRTTLLSLLFNRSRMGSDNRQEQTAWTNTYFGFSVGAKDYLLLNGFTKEEIIKYIEDQWDIREAAEAVK